MLVRSHDGHKIVHKKTRQKTLFLWNVIHSNQQMLDAEIDNLDGEKLPKHIDTGDTVRITSQKR